MADPEVAGPQRPAGVIPGERMGGYRLMPDRAVLFPFSLREKVAKS
jgi:hypothetical protein